MRSERGMLIVLSGPSGSGKGTLVKSLLSRRDDTVLSVSVTTRAPRPGEEEGGHYLFRTREEVEAMIAARQQARKEKNFAEADRIRDELKAMGIELMDTPQGVKWKQV